MYKKIFNVLLLHIFTILMASTFILQSTDVHADSLSNRTRKMINEKLETAREHKIRVPRAYTRWGSGPSTQKSHHEPLSEITTEAIQTQVTSNLRQINALKNKRNTSTPITSTTDTQNITYPLSDVIDYDIKMSGKAAEEEQVPKAQRVESKLGYKVISEVVAPCSLEDIPDLSRHEHHSFTEIDRQMSSWAATAPSVRVYSLGQTSHTRVIRVLDIDLRAGIIPKKNVLIIAGINGRDQHAVSAALHLARRLLGRHPLLAWYRFFVLPILNPDGYHRAFISPQNRDWIKNVVRDAETTPSCQRGVNINRNFEYQWIKTMPESEGGPCGPLYGGSTPLSQPESKAIAAFRPRPDVLITLKEDDIMGVMYPYSYTRAKRFGDEKYRQKSLMAAEAASKQNGVQYAYGQYSEFFPLYAGGMEDWMQSHYGTENVYTIIVNKAVNKTADIEKTSKAAFAAVESLLLEDLTLSIASDGSLASTDGWICSLVILILL